MSSRPLNDHDLALFLLAHKSIRGDLGAIVHTASSLQPGDQPRAAQLVEWFTLLETLVHHHHTSEDTQLYPLLTGKDASFAETERRLEGDHRTLDPMLRAAHSGLASLAAATDERFTALRDELILALRPLQSHMDEHLEREEAAVVPRLLQFVTFAELKDLEREMARGISYREMSMLLPWMASRASENELTLMNDVLPWPVKLLYRMSWKRRFDKLASALAA